MKTAVQIALAATAWLALGIPLWLNTVEVDRADLDFVELKRYESLASQNIETAIRVAVRDPQIPDIAAASEFYVNRRLDESKSSYKFIFDDECSSQSEVCIVGGIGDGDILELDTGKHELKITYTHKTFISGQVPELVGMLLLDHIYKNEAIPDESSPNGSREEVTIQYSPQYHLTFSLFSEKGTQLDWDIGSALENSMGALLSELDTSVANITIDTQTALFAEMDPATQVDQSSDVRVVDQSQLPTFVDFAEWKLTSSLPYPTLNFILYVPETPLVIGGTSKPFPQFIVPQWGGVVIASPQQSGHKFSETELSPILDAFARQLLALLGMREPTNQALSSRASPEIMVSQLSRSWALRGLKAAASSLGSLGRLAGIMPHIAIPQEVATNAELAMRDIDIGMKQLAEGNHSEAAASAGRAYVASGRAFFDKHMVSQAYFPDEHKIAVYMPLIGPLCVVVTSGWLRYLKSKKAEKTQQNEKGSR